MDVRLRWWTVILLLVGSRLTACQDSSPDDDDDGSTSGDFLLPKSPVGRRPRTCDGNPCNNNGKCKTETYGASTIAVCTCNNGFQGRYCDQSVHSVHPCVPDPCQSPTVCRVDRTKSKGYVCTISTCSSCRPWETCEIIGGEEFCIPADSGPCAASPCRNGGTCTVSPGGSGIAVCTCANGFQGPYCGQLVHACLSSPCQSPKVCRVDRTKSKGYVCICGKGRSGEACSQRSISTCSNCRIGETCRIIGGEEICLPAGSGHHPCVPSPCRNGGACRVDPGGSGYTCECSGGYDGKNCEVSVRDHGDGRYNCNDYTCVHGVCETSTRCRCYSGWQGQKCDVRTRADCTVLPCLYNGICRTDLRVPRCDCLLPHYGPRCEYSEANPCLSSPCQNGGICNRYRSPFCECVGGYSGSFCEIAPTNNCSPNPCRNGATCIATVGLLPSCRCTPEYEGRYCERMVNPCSSYRCENGGICVQFGRDGVPTCRCPNGFVGDRCETRIDLCLGVTCYNSGVCQRTTGQCSCVGGYSGQDCRIPPNRCNGYTCLNGGTCRDNSGVPTCHCPNGFLGAHCETQDRCFGKTCYNSGVCQRATGSCLCVGGYTGTDCRIPQSRCNNHDCLNGGSCVEDWRSGIPMCRCLDGFVGAHCERSDLCFGKICYNSGICQRATGRCSCVGGYSGPNCRIPPNRCSSNTCLNGGTCRDGRSFPTCLCRDGFGGARCESRMDDSCFGKTCYNEGVCQAGKCRCVRGFSGEHCQTPPDRCSDGTCLNGGTCYENGRVVGCNCVDGFVGNWCQSTDPCNSNPCQNGGTCRGYVGSLTCKCAIGYWGDSCQNSLSACDPNPCRNQGTCRLSPSSFPEPFICSCAEGWIGITCERPNSNAACSPNPCQNGCDCIPSCRHANAYYCKGNDGLLGKNCQLPAPVVDCGANSISITIDARIVEEYDAGIGGFTMFMSRTSSMTSTTPTCPAQNAGRTYSIVLPLPFTACGSTVGTAADGNTEVTNVIWLNRIIAGGLADMPVPILEFTCSYSKRYSVITRLTPAINFAPTITETGSTGSASIELCKSQDYCLTQCPPMYSMTRGATYTVGELLNLRITLDNMVNEFRVQDLFLSCQRDSATPSTAPVVLVENGCLNANSGKYLRTTVRSAATGTCASFPVPLLKGCADFYIHAKLQPCSGNCRIPYGACTGRRKRSEQSAVNETHAAKPLNEVFGPIVVIEGEEGVVIAKAMYPGETYFNSTDIGVLVLKDEQPRQLPSTEPSEDMLPLKVSLGVLLVLAVVLLTLLVIFNRRFINAHCGRKV